MSDWYLKYNNGKFIKNEYQNLLTISEDEVLVRPLNVGICGSDLFAIKHKSEAPPVGHEWVGEVLEIGSDIKGLSPGEFVTSSANYCCQRCKSCLSKDWDNCSNRKLLGSEEVSVLSSKVIVHSSDLVKLPQDLSLNSLVLLEVAFIGDMSFHKAQEIGLKIGDSIAIFGAGPIGIFSYLSLKHRGFNPVIVETNKERIEKAEELEINVENFASFLISGSNFNKYDFVIDCTGDGAGGKGILPQLHMFPKKSGGVVIVGKYFDAKLDNNSFHRYNLRVSWLGYHDVKDFRKSVDFWTPLIEKYTNSLVETFSFEDIDKAFISAEKRESFKTVLVK